MKCPVCPDSTLLMTDRQGVEIDYCAQCRGVWLDRGELDKLVGLAAAQPLARQVDAGRRPDFAESDNRSRSWPGAQAPYSQQPQRKKSWLNEIFD